MTFSTSGKREEAKQKLMPILEEEDEQEISYTHRRQIPHRHIGILSVGYAILAVWSMTLLWQSYEPKMSDKPKLYSMMDESVEYEIQTFNQGLYGERTIFMGTPNEESERAWRNITKYGIIKLNQNEVDMLPQGSALWIGHEGYYVGGVEMFHQLHCLDKIRKWVWAEQPQLLYGREHDHDENVDHIDHCIDFLRQTLMCHGSTDIITFRWDDTHGVYKPNFDNPHVCRKYEPLREWTARHRAGRNTPDGFEEESE